MYFPMVQYQLVSPYSFYNRLSKIYWLCSLFLFVLKVRYKQESLKYTDVFSQFNLGLLMYFPQYNLGLYSLHSIILVTDLDGSRQELLWNEGST
jgi:hypothetical protein